MIYHLARQGDWAAAQGGGGYGGGAQDRRDGYIHFSTAAQIVESAAKHRAGEPDLLLLAVDEARLGDALRWEASRGGALFPHLYGTLAPDAVAWTAPLPLGPDGRHVFPALPD
ncbi:MAG: DUF952 domain-containing protein [Alphaproteobacteria bacterium]